MSKRNSMATKVRAFMKKNPNVTPKDVAMEFGTSVQYVYALRYAERAKQAKAKAEVSTPKPKAKPTVQIELFEPPDDPVNHPAHYKVGGIETIDFIEAKRLNYHLGNVIKYITRADHKGDRRENLLKARWYLERELQSLQT